MKTLPADLATHLATGATTLAWCWRLTRADGSVFGFTNHDRMLTFDSTDFQPGSGFDAAELREGSDMAVDAQDAQGVLSSDLISESDILAGLWDAAKVEIWRVNWAAPVQRVLMRRGVLGEVRRGRVIFTAEVRSLACHLSQPIGRTFQSTCDAKLGDGRCKVDLSDAAFSAPGTVTALLRDRAFTAAALAARDAGLFTLGRLAWTSGANTGRTVLVGWHDAGAAAATLTLDAAPISAIAVGDAFNVVAGCDKRLGTCVARFANQANFRGFPNIPGNDSVLRYAGTSGGHSGTVL